LSSAGVGVRFKGWRYWNASLNVAVPFEDAAFTKAGDARVHFRMAYEF
jgi:hemolysin activation/secretion protein